MSKSPPRDLCWLFKSRWDVHFSDKGWTYTITSRDMLEAKAILDANGEVEWEYLERCMPQFFASPFWEEQRWPAWGFFKHLSRYHPPPAPRPKRRVLIECSNCNSVHDRDEKCKVEAKT